MWWKRFDYTYLLNQSCLYVWICLASPPTPDYCYKWRNRSTLPTDNWNNVPSYKCSEWSTCSLRRSKNITFPSSSLVPTTSHSQQWEAALMESRKHEACRWVSQNIEITPQGSRWGSQFKKSRSRPQTDIDNVHKTNLRRIFHP